MSELNVPLLLGVKSTITQRESLEKFFTEKIIRDQDKFRHIGEKKGFNWLILNVMYYYKEDQSIKPFVDDYLKYLTEDEINTIIHNKFSTTSIFMNIIQIKPSPDIVTMLIMKGANINAKTSMGSPLIFFLYISDLNEFVNKNEILDIFIENGVDLIVISNLHKNILHYACGKKTVSHLEFKYLCSKIPNDLELLMNYRSTGDEIVTPFEIAYVVRDIQFFETMLNLPMDFTCVINNIKKNDWTVVGHSKNDKNEMMKNWLIQKSDHTKN